MENSESTAKRDGSFFSPVPVELTPALVGGFSSSCNMFSSQTNKRNNPPSKSYQFHKKRILRGFCGRCLSLHVLFVALLLPHFVCTAFAVLPLIVHITFYPPLSVLNSLLLPEIVPTTFLPTLQ